jgi:hypothetical protein
MVSRSKGRAEMWMIENKVLRRESESKREQDTEEWIEMPNEDIHNLYSSCNIKTIKIGKREGRGI